MQSHRPLRRRFGAPVPLIRRAPVTLGALSLALLAAGCASSQPPSYRVAGPPLRPDAATVKVEVEDDGLPSQLAPRHPRQTPDDPSEPWSPNYGSSGAAARPAIASAPAITRIAVGRQPVPAVMPSRAIDADDIIRHAIAEHERSRN
ncbi:MAG: adhesin [Hyphomicrobiaceae bacterium]|nr:adhesin [Hyphomicrobiaceae bacterium]